MNNRFVGRLITLLTVVGLVILNHAQADMLVEKQSFQIENFTTFGGKQIPHVTVGWENYGSLNENKDNVILITHYFTGNSHAAGKYSKDDPAAGYWDGIIGPGKAIDTNRFFVVSVDSLANLGVHNPNVITTGPASTNPKTGKPYGLDFPVVTIRDFINVQKALLESLGVSELYAVAGPSMGSMQAIDWAATYPEWVPRMMSVIGASRADAWTTSYLEHWATPIKLDSNWRDGNYYQSSPPIDGLTASLMLITQNALAPEFFNQTGDEQLDYHPLESSPLQSIRQSHSVIDWLQQRASSRAATMDANHLLYLVRACQLFVAGHADDFQNSLNKITAKSLFITAQSDLLLMPYHAIQTHHQLKKLGKSSELIVIDGPLGHLEGITGITGQAQSIAKFLAD